MFYYFLAIPVLSIGVERFSERQVAFTGFLLCTSGFAVSSLARNLYFLIFSISILVGKASFNIYNGIIFPSLNPVKIFQIQFPITRITTVNK